MPLTPCTIVAEWRATNLIQRPAWLGLAHRKPDAAVRGVWVAC